MSAMHTPGPWVAMVDDFGNIDGCNYCTVDTGTQAIAYVFDRDRATGKQIPEVISNTLVMAAALDLLASVSELLEHFGHIAGDVTDPAQSEEEMRAVERARAAIAKATGATP